MKFGGTSVADADAIARVVGIVKAALDTIKAVLLEPANTFSRMKRVGGLWEPLLFYMIAGTVGGSEYGVAKAVSLA